MKKSCRTTMHAICCNGTHWEKSTTSDINVNATVQHQIFNGVWLCNLIFSVWMRGKSHYHKLSGLVSKQEETELVAFSDMTLFLQR